MGLENHVTQDETWHERGYPPNSQVMPYNKGSTRMDHLKSIQFVQRTLVISSRADDIEGIFYVIKEHAVK